MVRRVLAAAVLLSAMSHAALAQEVRQQATTITFPSHTPDENWARSTTLMHDIATAGLAYAKSQGGTPESYGRALGALIAPSWGASDGGTAIGYARGLQGNLTARVGTTVELLAVSDTLVTLRASRSWRSLFAPSGTLLGVTLAEYDAMYAAIRTEIARYLGLRFEQRVDSATVTMTIAGRGRKAVVAFPFGTYGFSISDQDPAASPDLVGSWQITFSPDRRFVAQKDGEPVANGTFDLGFDELVWHNDPNGPCPDAARYRWTATAGADTLRFAPIADGCDARVAVLGRRALVRR